MRWQPTRDRCLIHLTTGAGDPRVVSSLQSHDGGVLHQQVLHSRGREPGIYQYVLLYTSTVFTDTDTERFDPVALWTQDPEVGNNPILAYATRTDPAATGHG